MEIKRTSASPASAAPGSFKMVISDEKVAALPQDKAELAARIDNNRDGLLTDAEVRSFMQANEYIKAPGSHGQEDTEKIVADYKDHLQGKPHDRAKGYHSYEEQLGVLQKLATEHPDRAEVVSVGKTFEGRDIWGLHVTSNVTEDASNKPGVVFTGAHHAREWMSMEIPLDLAQRLVNEYDSDPAMKARVDNADIWLIPTVNPDGYEYSRTEDSWWRKNRRPNFEGEGCPGTEGTCPAPQDKEDGKPIAYGVDPNRNYWDGNPEHIELYRPKGDDPCNTGDDSGVTSDAPWSDTYRGPAGGSEPEVQAMLNLELGRPNIKGVIDHHGYGELLLRPWGWTENAPANIADYDEVAGRMLAAQKNKYTYEAAIDLYPTTGTSTDTLHANGKLAFTIELGREFQPNYAKFDKSNVEVADFAFLDYIIEKNPVQPPAPTPAPPPSEPTNPPEQAG